MNQLIDAGYSIAKYDGYIIVATNNWHRPRLPVNIIQDMLPQYKCISWYGKVKVIL